MALNFDFKSMDVHKLKKLADPKAASDLNHFLEQLPQKAGQNALIAAGIAWSMAAALGLYAAVQTQKMTEMRHTLMEEKAVVPSVPAIKDVPVNRNQITELSDTLGSIYPGLNIKPQGSAIYIAAGTTSAFGAFREAVGHVQNGGDGWRVQVDRLCVGRECDREKLAILLRVNKVSVEKPH